MSAIQRKGLPNAGGRSLAEDPRAMNQNGDLTQPLDTEWPLATAPLSFPTERVDIWRVHLDRSPLDGSLTQGPDTGVLSPDEIARANRFHFEKDRVHFVRCRTALRQLLGEYLGIPASEIQFRYSTNGKPQLEANLNPRALQFNVSHSADLAAIAIGSEHRLGVDLEKIRIDVDVVSLSTRFFSLRERAELQALPEHFRVSAFFACWTRKEAFLKATGEGLSFPLENFSVSVQPDSNPKLEEVNEDSKVGEQWFLADIHVGVDYRAALAIERRHTRLQTYSFGWKFGVA
jgi:4'-phosphopantetheinyl transferase